MTAGHPAGLLGQGRQQPRSYPLEVRTKVWPRKSKHLVWWEAALSPWGSGTWFFSSLAL